MWCVTASDARRARRVRASGALLLPVLLTHPAHLLHQLRHVLPREVHARGWPRPEGGRLVADHTRALRHKLGGMLHLCEGQD
jgi:hypothetical protein